ncbi:MAG: GntR family transcriptional regulator [Burkholderiaceae bacterium]|nr:GntR family transcriptional regulator [Burkholderiaceae bacterium]
MKRTDSSAAIAKNKARPARAGSGLTKAKIAPLKRSVLPERVSQVIIQGLLDGRLRPGDRLIESDLVGILGVSRSPIREALTELAQSGVIDREPGRGGRIREWSKRDLEDLFGVRSELEGYAARLLCSRFKPQHRAKFDRIVASMRDAARRTDFLAMIDLDLEFHDLLWKLTDNGLLHQVLASLGQQFRLFLTLNWKFHGGLDEVADNHVRLLDAIATNDPVKAEKAMRQHVVVEKMVAALRAHEEEIAAE